MVTVAEISDEQVGAATYELLKYLPAVEPAWVRLALEAAHKVEGQGPGLMTPEERVAQLEAAIPGWRKRVEELTQQVIEGEGALRELLRFCEDEKPHEGLANETDEGALAAYESVIAHICSQLNEET